MNARQRSREVDVLLIGGGVASARCARTLRRHGFDGSIALVGDEALPPYNRPPLSKELLRDALPDELLLAEQPGWYARRDVDLVTGRRVASLLADERVAVLDDGSRMRFGRGLLATGAAPRPLEIPGGERALLLRTVADARALRDAAVTLPAGSPVAVIGGGLIGVEVASALAALGLRPTLHVRGPLLWGGRLGAELAAWATQHLVAAGVAVRLGARVVALEGGAVVAGEEHVPAELVAAGIGVRPLDQLAADAGLEVRDGVGVDDAQRTSHAAVWAAGDVARVAGVRIEHWHAAREQGERAALSMLGEELPRRRAPWAFTEVAGTPVDVFGEARKWDDERWTRDRSVLACVREGMVVQLAVVGSAIPADAARRLIETPIAIGDLDVAVDAAAG